MSETPIADMVEKMVSGGIPPEFIIVAIRAAEMHAGGKEDPVAERRRAYDRERKRNRIGNSTGNSAEGHIDTKKDLIKESKKASISISRASRIPPEWAPDVAAAKALGLTDSDIAKETPRFRDYWTARPGKEGTKLDWNATWRNWCRTFAEKHGRSPPADSKIVPMAGHYAAFDSPEMDAWAAHERATGKSHPRDRSGGWRFPTQWPPGYQSRAG